MAIPEGETINCRVKVHSECEHGKPTVERMDPEGDGMCEDGTWDGESVVCTVCYIEEGMPVNNANPGLILGGKGTPR